MCANSAATFASEHRANLELLHANTLQLGRDLLVDELIRFDDLFLFLYRIYHRLATDTSNDARGQIDNFFVALVDRAYNDAVDSPAIFFVDDHILRGIDELACERTGVRSFERGVGETFAGAMGRDEVFQHAQTFSEI